jgi:XTP/dITP diphosphohydrolase
MELLLATRNKNKIIEMTAFLKGLKLRIRSLEDFRDAPNVVEDGKTFEENAAKKALAYAKHTGLLTLADDSGLMVDALRGAPGVNSHRYAGPNATDFENNMKLLDELKDIDDSHRTAKFVCCIALAYENRLIRTVTGKCDGVIITEPRGREGFGYDPLFMKTDYKMTFAEMSLEIKNRISHRAMALEKAMLAIESYLLSL